MSEKWGEKIDQKTLYDLFPLDPSKQGGRIAGLPESRRKGGYWPRPAACYTDGRRRTSRRLHIEACGFGG